MANSGDSPAQDALIPGEIHFIQHHLPALEAGEYTLEVRHQLSMLEHDPKDQAKTTTRTPDIPVVSHRFQVRGERFTLPKTEINRRFPDNGTTGEYANVLPHIVLARRTLPWERTPQASGAPVIKRVGEKQESDVSSWLALLLFDEAEIAQVPGLTVTQGRLADLRRPGDGVSLFTAGAVPESSEQDDDPVHYIDVPRDLFDQVAPSLGDLKVLAHARRITVPPESHPDGAKADADGTDKPLDTDYAVVVGNRLPRAGANSTVYVVSLERLGAHLPDDDGTPSAKNKDVPFFRLPVLLNAPWRFRAKAEQYSFKQILEALNGNHSRTSLLRLDGDYSDAAITGTDPDAYAARALAAGYTALEHSTREGDATVSWYRGPLTPYPVDFVIGQWEGNTLDLPDYSADALTGYDPGTGMFDISYSAAWQIGRLLALNSRQFATEIYYWKRDQKRMRAGAYEMWRLADAHLQAGDLPQDPTARYPALAKIIKQVLADHAEAQSGQGA